MCVCVCVCVHVRRNGLKNERMNREGGEEREEVGEGLVNRTRIRNLEKGQTFREGRRETRGQEIRSLSFVFSFLY